jgi:hypothetical protein
VIAVIFSAETASTLAEIGALLWGLESSRSWHKIRFSVVPIYLLVGLLVGQGGFGLILVKTFSIFAQIQFCC